MVLALLKAHKIIIQIIKISKISLHFLVLEYLLEIICLRKRFFTKALIAVLLDTKISGENKILY